MFQIKSTGFLHPGIRIREKYLRMRNMTSERSEMTLDLFLVWTNYFSLSRWMYLILGNVLALNRRENLDKISWFVLLLDSGAAHLSTCTFRYIKKQKNTWLYKLQDHYIPYIAFGVADPGLFWRLDPGSGAFLTTESGILDGKKSRARIRDQGWTFWFHLG